MTQRITKIINILVLSLVVVIVLFTNLTESKCYNDSHSGRVILDTQNLTGWGFITEENPPKPMMSAGSYYSFENFQFYTILMVGIFVLLICLQAFKAKLIVVIGFTACLAVAFWAGLQFTQYPNYYFEQCDQNIQGISSITIDSNTPVFPKLLLISIGLVLFNWMVYLKNRKKKRVVKPWSTELLDN